MPTTYAHENVFGTDDAETIIARVRHVIINSENDVYVGQIKVSGGGGDDVIYGLADSRFVLFDGFNSTLAGGDGDDTLYGGSLRDYLVGEDDDDTLYGGQGNDYLTGNSGDDHLYGGADDDYLRPEDGDDWVDGGDGNDHIYHANGGIDTMLGGG